MLCSLWILPFYVVVYLYHLKKSVAMLYYTSQDWALSSTRNFMDNDIDYDTYVVANTSRLNVFALDS